MWHDLYITIIHHFITKGKRREKKKKFLSFQLHGIEYIFLWIRVFVTNSEKQSSGFLVGNLHKNVIVKWVYIEFIQDHDHLYKKYLKRSRLYRFRLPFNRPLIDQTWCQQEFVWGVKSVGWNWWVMWGSFVDNAVARSAFGWVFHSGE